MGHKNAPIMYKIKYATEKTNLTCNPLNYPQWESGPMLHTDERRSSLFLSSQEAANHLQKEQLIFSKTCSGFGQQDFGTFL